MEREYKTIQWKLAEGIGLIIFNRPEKYNAMNEKMMEEISDLLNRYVNDKEVKVICFTGTGKSFLTGADINDLNQMTPLDALNPSMQALYEKIYNYPKPTVAGINGYALGGGMELAASCDIRIAGDKATFGMPECNLNVIPGAGGTQRLVRLLGEARAKELILLGDWVNAEQAKDIGFVTTVVQTDVLEEKILECGRKMIKRGPLALQLSKKAIHYSNEIPIEVGTYIENLSQAVLFSTKDKHEGVNAFIEKREPNFIGE